jgi:MoxR-like ATPase
VRRTTGRNQDVAEKVLDAAGVLDLQKVAVEVPLPDSVLQAILKLTHSTRPESPLADEYVKRYVEWGAGPRASQNLARAARALALLRGQATASIEEVREVALPVLRHRIIPNYQATGDGVSTEDIVKNLLAKI